MQVSVYTCAPLLDEFETTDRKPGFGQQNQFCVALRSVLFLQKTLSNGDDDRIGLFDFFTIEKREPLQHVFLFVASQFHYQSDFNFDTARLAVQLNRIIQNHSSCHYVATTHCIFPKSSSITLVVATVFLKTAAHNSYRFIL